MTLKPQTPSNDTTYHTGIGNNFYHEENPSPVSRSEMAQQGWTAGSTASPKQNDVDWSSSGPRSPLMFIRGKSASDVSPTMATFRLNQLAPFAVELKHVVCSNLSQSHSLTCVLTEELLAVQQETTCQSLALAILHRPPVAHFIFFSRVPLFMTPPYIAAHLSRAHKNKSLIRLVLYYILYMVHPKIIHFLCRLKRYWGWMNNRKRQS